MCHTDTAEYVNLASSDSTKVSEILMNVALGNANSVVLKVFIYETPVIQK